MALGRQAQPNLPRPSSALDRKSHALARTTSQMPSPGPGPPVECPALALDRQSNAQP